MAIINPLVDVFAFTKTGFNVYEIAALGSASFEVLRIVIEPAHPADAVSSTTTLFQSDSSDSLPNVGNENRGALDDLTIGLIAGGVALVVLIALILVVWLIKRPRRRSEETINSSLHDFGASARHDGDVFYQTPLPSRSHEYGNVGFVNQSQSVQSPKSSVSQYDSVTTPLD